MHGLVEGGGRGEDSSADRIHNDQVTSSAPSAGSYKLAATDEKDVSTSQSPTETDPRISGADGDAGRAQRAQAAAEQGPQAAGDFDSAEAAGLARARTRLSFGAADRLHRRSEYLHVQREGARFQTAHFVVYAARLDAGEGVRLGMAVSRRVGNAVVRNRIKRQVRECFRLTLRPMLREGTDLVVIVRAGAGELATPAIRVELEAATLNVSRRLRA